MNSVQSLLGDLGRFVEHRKFTVVQERVIPSLIGSNNNVLVSAPTGSGKTLLLEVAMLRLFRHRLLNHKAEGSQSEKAVYVCPIKALANEKYHHWKKMFPTLSVVIETGDQERDRLPEHQDNLSLISSADIIITTPERWDSITRRWKERAILDIVNAVSLILLDEIHTVHEERGASLEAMVSRMKTIKAANAITHPGDDKRTKARFIAISGTLPNIEDFAQWLAVEPSMTFTFSAAERPVPLTIKVLGIASDSSNPFAFDKLLSFKLFGLIRQHSEGRPSIVFCASRKEAVSSAMRLVNDLRSTAAGEGGEHQLEPSSEVTELANKASDKQLRSCLLLGIAFHHAALSPSDRSLVERMFREQYVAVICTTTTLALGVNLPAHLVIVKGTTFFKGCKRVDVPTSEVAQMCGRAGRPGLDDYGTAIVLTTDDKVSKYEALQHGDAFTVVESQLHRHMIEHVNAEIALRTIHSFSTAMDWIQTTFFWIRLQKSPRTYGLTFATRADEMSFDPYDFAKTLMERVFDVLHREGCIEWKGHPDQIKEADGNSLPCETAGIRPSSIPVSSTSTGRSMARYYVLFDTVRNFNREVRNRRGTSDPENKDDDNEGEGVQADVFEAPRSTGDPFLKKFDLRDALEMLCCCEEFREEVRLRQGDRGPLNAGNKLVKFPIKSGRKGGREVREDWHKSFILIQARLSHISLTDISLRNDSVRLWSLVPRLARFFVEYARSAACYSFSLHANTLLHCVERQIWPDGLVLRQLEGVSEAVAKSLALGGIRDFHGVLKADHRKIEAVCSRLPPYGEQIHQQVAQLPACSLTTARGHGTKGGRRMTVTVALPLSNPPVQYKHISSFLLLVGSRDDDQLLLQRYIPMSALLADSEAENPVVGGRMTCEFTAASEIEISLLAQHWVGMDVFISTSGEPSVPAHPETLKPHGKTEQLQSEVSTNKVLEEVTHVSQRGALPVVSDMGNNRPVAKGDSSSFQALLDNLQYWEGSGDQNNQRKRQRFVDIMEEERPLISHRIYPRNVESSRPSPAEANRAMEEAPEYITPTTPYNRHQRRDIRIRDQRSPDPRVTAPSVSARHSKSPVDNSRHPRNDRFRFSVQYRRQVDNFGTSSQRVLQQERAMNTRQLRQCPPPCVMSHTRLEGYPFSYAGQPPQNPAQIHHGAYMNFPRTTVRYASSPGDAAFPAVSTIPPGAYPPFMYRGAYPDAGYYIPGIPGSMRTIQPTANDCTWW